MYLSRRPFCDSKSASPACYTEEGDRLSAVNTRTKESARKNKEKTHKRASAADLMECAVLSYEVGDLQLSLSSASRAERVT